MRVVGVSIAGRRSKFSPRSESSRPEERIKRRGEERNRKGMTRKKRRAVRGTGVVQDGQIVPPARCLRGRGRGAFPRRYKSNRGQSRSSIVSTFRLYLIYYVASGEAARRRLFPRESFEAGKFERAARSRLSVNSVMANAYANSRARIVRRYTCSEYAPTLPPSLSPRAVCRKVQMKIQKQRGVCVSSRSAAESRFPCPLPPCVSVLR